MPTQVRCMGCGAAVAADAVDCPYCGAAMNVAATPPAAPAPDPAAERAERFRRLTESLEYKRMLAWKPTSSGPVPGIAFLAVFGLVFAGVALGMHSFVERNFRDVSGRGVVDVVSFAPLAFALIGVGMFVVACVKWSRWRGAPLRAFPAIVAAKRSRVIGSRDDTRTEYFVTLETQKGARHEYAADGSFFGVAVEDDLGVAYVRDQWLLGFQRVDG